MTRPHDPSTPRIRSGAWADDTGSGGMSLMMLVAAIGLVMILGLIVDGGTKASALDRAGAIAAETARAAAGTYRPGDTAIDAHAASAAAANYLTAAGATGHITINGLSVTATATITENTIFLPLIGITSFTVTGNGDARITYLQGGAP